jgi:FkbM family methyltransferase
MDLVAFPNFECPPAMEEHIREILDGEYDLPYSRLAPVIIDIGANIGGFTLWASQRWERSTIHCYEPVPRNFEILLRNLSVLDRSRIHANNFAIGDPQWTRMFLGKNNCGEASFFDIGEQASQTINVETYRADILPPAHILKIDAEGSELDILQHVPMSYEVILIEYHGENKRRAVDTILRDYCLAGAQIRVPHRGVLKYVHRKIVVPDFAKYESRY